MTWGWESTLRKLVIPAIAVTPFEGCSGTVCDFRADEDLHHWHLDARLNKRWALATSLSYERQELKTPGHPFNVPAQLRTWQWPLRASYFSPTGWSTYAQLRGVKQSSRNDFDPAKAGSARFTLADIGVRYQAADRRFSCLIDIANLFDRRFNFQDTYLGGEPRVPQFQPGRTLSARMELRF